MPPPEGPLKAFFNRYSWFTYDPTESAPNQFHRLQTTARWKRADPEQQEAWEDYLEALVQQFNSSYGEDENDLAAWHGLLARIGIHNLPDSVKKCKSVSFEFSQCFGVNDSMQPDNSRKIYQPRGPR